MTSSAANGSPTPTPHLSGLLERLKGVLEETLSDTLKAEMVASAGAALMRADDGAVVYEPACTAALFDVAEDQCRNALAGVERALELLNEQVLVVGPPGHPGGI